MSASKVHESFIIVFLAFFRGGGVSEKYRLVHDLITENRGIQCFAAKTQKTPPPTGVYGSLPKKTKLTFNEPRL